MKCIIPCAGQGIRMGGSIPKTLIKVGNRTLLGHITFEWSGMVDSYVVIVSPQNEKQIKDYLVGIRSGVEFVVQKEPKGLANAILQAEHTVQEKFIIHLGDCLFRGEFEKSTSELGLGVWKTYDVEEVSKSYLVTTNHEGGISYLTEKPKIAPSPAQCGMGVYFLDIRVFDYIRTTPLKPGGGDFTTVLQMMIDQEEEIAPVYFEGEYINVTTPKDVKKAEAIINHS